MPTTKSVMHIFYAHCRPIAPAKRGISGKKVAWGRRFSLFLAPKPMPMNDDTQDIHFIAIGGSLMHNMAIALKSLGHQVSGSDDEIFEPSRSRLDAHGLLPPAMGWHPERLHEGLDAVVLGMHATADNPELAKAKALGLRVFSFPEYIYEQAKDKLRVVVAGSHGKTTITAMVAHVLRHQGMAFDYAIGAQLKGFEQMVRFSDAPIIVIEGDEYLSSPIDRVPKFLKYKHHIGLVSGVAWDHVNVFPDQEEYIRQFRLFAQATPEVGGTLIYSEEDPLAVETAAYAPKSAVKIAYPTHPHQVRDGQTSLSWGDQAVGIKVFGAHNMQNLNGAKAILTALGVGEEAFYEAIASFEGADKRLQCLRQAPGFAYFKDYAHAPSKVQATVAAMKAQYPDRRLAACLELHTFSSLNKGFLDQYKDSMAPADLPMVYFNPKTIQHKKLPPISAQDIRTGFGHPALQVFYDSAKLRAFLVAQPWQSQNLLMMSSGNFDGLDHENLADTLSAINFTD